MYSGMKFWQNLSYNCLFTLSPLEPDIFLANSLILMLLKSPKHP